MKNIIPTSSERIEEIIKELENADISSLSIDEIKIKLNELIVGYSVVGISLQPGFLIYRGIRYTTKPFDFSFLSYPPSNISVMGRANRPGIPVFYCATEKNVPFFELDAKCGERFVLTEWTVEKDLLTNTVGYTKTVLKILNSTREFPIPQPVDTEKHFERIGNIKVQNFLASKFSQRVSPEDGQLYKLTNAIAEKHFSEKTSFEAMAIKAIMYPTVRMQGNADNLAITQLAIDKGYVSFNKVEYIEIISFANNIYQFKILDVAFKVKDGQIQWENLDYHWITDSSRSLYLVQTDEFVEAYDSQGELIESRQNNA